MTNTHQEKEQIVREAIKKFRKLQRENMLPVSDFQVQFIQQIADRMYQKGYEKGILEEATGCDEHTEFARKEGYQQGVKDLKEKIDELREY